MNTAMSIHGKLNVKSKYNARNNLKHMYRCRLGSFVRLHNYVCFCFLFLYLICIKCCKCIIASIYIYLSKPCMQFFVYDLPRKNKKIISIENMCNIEKLSSL